MKQRAVSIDEKEFVTTIDEKDAVSILNAMSVAKDEGLWDDPELIARIKAAFPQAESKHHDWDVPPCTQDEP